MARGRGTTRGRGAGRGRGGRGGSRVVVAAVAPVPVGPFEKAKAMSKGWKSSELVWVKEFDVEKDMDVFHASWGLLGTGAVVGAPTGSARVLGIRVKVDSTVAVQAIQWAAACVNGLSPGVKTLAEVKTVVAWKGDHDPAVSGKWYTIDVSKVESINHLTEAHQMGFLVSGETRCVEATKIKFEWHVTFAAPTVASGVTTL